MKIICYYNKNLKMSEGKLAAQVGHVCKEIGRKTESEYSKDIIVVLGLRQNKFTEKLLDTIESVSPSEYHTQVDWGITEVDKDTITCFGYIEDEKY